MVTLGLCKPNTGDPIPNLYNPQYKTAVGEQSKTANFQIIVGNVSPRPRFESRSGMIIWLPFANLLYTPVVNFHQRLGVVKDLFGGLFWA